MKKADKDLDRLLRSAATAEEPVATEAPYGFDTRVIALWRAGGAFTNEAAELTGFLRRIGAVAIAVALLTSISVYRQFNEDDATITPPANEYAIADSAIQTEFSQ
jgi:hypothetical protein